MNNPFKFGTIVDGEFFTDRVQELQYVLQILNSENHLVLISPRRFGKSSLVNKALQQTDRKSIVINMQSIVSVQHFACKLMDSLMALYPFERLKQMMKHFRIIPSITTNPMTDVMEVSFTPGVDMTVVLEDAMALLQKVCTEQNRMIVVLDEFQEVESIAKGFDKQLRSIMQTQTNINYIFLGSQESMMENIFEKKKSPFYHFGQLIRLNKIPREDFKAYLLRNISDEAVVDEILDFTSCHPYYTQQMAFHVWNMINYEGITDNLVQQSIERIVTLHDLDFERLWMNFNKSDRRVMMQISKSDGVKTLSDPSVPTSTTFSILKKLMRQGFVIRTTQYEIEDPFFSRWIYQKM